MAANLIRIVDVQDRGMEVARAELVQGAIRYSGDESVARSPIMRKASDLNITDVEAFALVAETGWSNGYLMVALDS